MSGILILESLTRGNTLKQGDKTPLKYRLFDADGEKLNIAGKSAKVRLVYPDFLTIGYEKDGLTVAQDDTVTFTIDRVIPSRIYHVEIIVDEQFIFPSRADESKFTVDKSSFGTETNIIEIVGVDAIVKKAVNLINEDPSLIIDEDKLVTDIISNTGIGSIEEYHQQFNDVITELSEDKDYHSLPEIAGARGGHETLGQRLDETTAQLAQTVKQGEGGVITPAMLSQETKEQMTGGSVAVVGENAILTENIIDKQVTPEKTSFVDVKNIFNGEYVDATLNGTLTSATIQSNDSGKTAVIPIRSNTYYTISKTDSDRFRVALTYGYPSFGDQVKLIKADGGDSETEYTFYSEDRGYVLIYVSNENSPPNFMQVEEGETPTEWHTHGYYIELAKKYGQSETNTERANDGRVYVSDFEGGGKSDREVIQEAFDVANRQIVVFEPKQYVIDNTVVADASKVRGIEGQNCLIQITENDVPVLSYKGSKTAGNADPGGNQTLAVVEMNPFIKHLRVSSHNQGYIGTGIEIEGLFGLLIDHCHVFNLKHGIVLKGVNRNLIFSNNNIYNNSGWGIHWDNCSLHQHNLTGNHISYCKKALYLENSDLHNLQISGNDIESGDNAWSGSPENVIHVFIDQTGFNYEAIHIVGNSLQDHNRLSGPLLKFESSARFSGIQDLIIGNNQIANSANDSIWAEGLERATITGNSFKGNSSDNCIVLEGNNKDVTIVGNNLMKGVSHSAGTHRTLFGNNVANDFDMEDMDDGRVKMVGNFSGGSNHN